MKYIKLVFFTLLFVACNSSKETDETIDKKDDRFQEFTAIVDDYAETMLQRGNVNSFALAIYKDGKSYRKYYGELDNGKQNTPNDSTLYEIASITKTFTGGLVAKAVLDTKINLEDDIRKYLKGDYTNLEFNGQPITVKHLLTHSLGLKHKTPKGLAVINQKIKQGTYNSETDVYNIQSLLEELKTVELDKKPGTVYQYNSVGPELLAYILEQVNGKSFKEQLNDFLTELGMHNTYLQDYEKHKKYLANSYRDGELTTIDFNPLYGAAGGAISSLPDMETYMQYLLVNKNKPWIKEASQLLFEDKEEDETVGYLWQNIGFGEEEGYYYSKTGTSNGVQSGVLLCPDSDYGIVLFINSLSDAAFNDWGTLFFTQIESDLIKYPKLNLISQLKNDFIIDTDNAIKKYNTLKADSTYFTSADGLNNFGYELLNGKHQKKAITVFKFATEQYPNNANLFDSLGEAYFINEDYDNALKNYKTSLELNPENENAKVFVKRIEDLKK